MTPQELSNEAACFSCIPGGLSPSVIIYLLNRIANTGFTPEQLEAEAKCFSCIPPGASNAVSAFLLNNILSNCGGGGGSGYLETVTSAIVIDIEGTTSDESEINLSLLESVSQNLYILSDPGTEVLNFPTLISIGTRFVLGQDASLVEVNAPLLETTGGWLNIDSCPNLITINLPLFESCGEDFGIFVCGSLVSLSLPSFVNAVNGVNVLDCPLLSDVSLPSFLPADGILIGFTGNALTAASVNHILARCVANAGYVSGSVDLSGGTNAAPTGQGIVDKGILIGRGITVTTN